MFSSAHFSRDAQGLGDDAFLLKHGEEILAISCDSSVEKVHYRLDWSSPVQALRKCLLSNLSDINAMGGATQHIFFNLGAHRDWNESVVISLGRELMRMENFYNFKVSGGDTVRCEESSFFSFTVLGAILGKALLRSSAKPGHKIYVSGCIGHSAAGLHFLKLRQDQGNLGNQVDVSIAEEFISRHLEPEPPLALGPFLAKLAGSGAAIDISDGLSSEAWHLSRQSNCRLRLNWLSLPRDEKMESQATTQLCETWMLHGGEDYQLLFTGNFSDSELLSMRELVKITEIGIVEEGIGLLLEREGRIEEIQPGGYSHS